MKAFRIDRRSWHYRLNRHFLNEDGFSERSMELNWEPRHRDFCSYWRATVLRMVVLTLLTVSTVFLLTGLLSIVYHYPLETLKGVGAVVGTIAAVVGLIVASETLKSRKQNQPEGLISQRLRAYKSQVCPLVEYDE
jgi:hypothetical protein